MAIINLRDYYPFYTSDCFMEVSEEVAEMFKEFDRKEAAYRLRTYRHKAYYSLDRDDGLEHEAVFVALSPHELYERKVTMQELHGAGVRAGHRGYKGGADADMAVTKIHPIKSTLKKALDYIENPDKTYDKMLVSSFACSYETADIEFEMLLAQAYQKSNNLAHHLIQSFAPGEATPEQAHEIGRQLADEVLQGKYPYVLTTHIDKGHVHNHIIFCAVDMVNQRKYISNKQSYAYIRRTSDRLCKENGLSVVKPGQSKGKSYAEWDAQRKGTSWKAKLKAAIDAAIPQAKDFDDFLRLMQAQGYEIKPGKFISFRAPGQERFTRCKTLGEAYTEEAIKERIKGRVITRVPKERKGISLRIDLENNIKAQQSAGYEKWVTLHNLKQAAKTLNLGP